MKKAAEYLDRPGACLVSRNVLSGAGRVKWINREAPMDEVDSGWRFLSDIDDDAFLSDPANMAIADYNTVANIEPAIIAVYPMPVGTDLQLVTEGGRLRFVDNLTKSFLPDRA